MGPVRAPRPRLARLDDADWLLSFLDRYLTKASGSYQVRVSTSHLCIVRERSQELIDIASLITFSSDLARSCVDPLPCSSLSHPYALQFYDTVMNVSLFLVRRAQVARRIVSSLTIVVSDDTQSGGRVRTVPPSEHLML